MKMEKILTQATLETNRCQLRPLELSDAGVIDLYAGDERVARQASRIPHPYPPGAAEAFVQASLSEERSETVWAIDLKHDTKPALVGLISLKPIDDGCCEVGFWIAPALWNAGYASEALAALVEENPLDCKTIVAAVFQDNPASAKVITKSGFAYLGEAEGFCVARNALVPTWTYVLKQGQ